MARERHILQRRGLLHENLHPARTALLLSQQKREARNAAEVQQPAKHEGQNAGEQQAEGCAQHGQQPSCQGQLPWARMARLAHAAGDTSSCGQLPDEDRKPQPIDGRARLDLSSCGALAAPAADFAAEVDSTARPAATAGPSHAAALCSSTGRAEGGYDDVDSDEVESEEGEEALEGEAGISTYLRAQLRDLVKVRCKGLVGQQEPVGRQESRQAFEGRVDAWCV